MPGISQVSLSTLDVSTLHRSHCRTSDGGIYSRATTTGLAAATFQDNGRWRVVGHRDDVDVLVILEPDGQIVTAWPLSGGRGVVKNPPKGQT